MSSTVSNWWMPSTQRKESHEFFYSTNPCKPQNISIHKWSCTDSCSSVSNLHLASLCSEELTLQDKAMLCVNIPLCACAHVCVCVCIEICVGIFYFKWRRVSHFKKKKSSAAQTEQKHSVCKKTVIQQTEQHCANFQIVQKSAAFKLLKVALFCN